jgi:hypothetical protein
LKSDRPESAYDAENSEIPVSLFYMDRSVVDLPCGLPFSAKALRSELVNITKYI